MVLGEDVQVRKTNAIETKVFFVKRKNKSHNRVFNKFNYIILVTHDYNHLFNFITLLPYYVITNQYTNKVDFRKKYFCC